MPRAADLQPRRIYSRQALERMGAHTRLLASPELVRVMPGCYMRADAPAPLAEIARVLQTHVVPRSVISHQTAGELLGLPLPTPLTRAGGSLLHCSLPRAGGPRRSRLVVIHSAHPHLLARVGAVVTTHPVAVLQELSAFLDLDDLVVGLDAIAGGQGALEPLPMDQIRAAIGALRGRGSAAVRRALPLACERVWSPMETRTRLLLVRDGLPAPRPNLEVRDPVAGSRFYLDLAYPQWRIAIEYDSEEHRLNRARWRRDLHKNEVLHQLGWTVLRISVADLRYPADFLRRVRAAIAACPAVA